MRPAFSTVACPDWTFTEIAAHAGGWGFLGCELRTFGYGSTKMACDPALTAPAKSRSLLERAGLEVVSLATSARFDDPITPPVVGMIFSDTEHSVRETKSAIDLALAMEVPYVRVFGFEVSRNERMVSAVARIAGRLSKSLDHARNSGVKIMLENGGSFSTAAQMAELMDEVNSPLLVAAYSIPVALAAGDKPADAANVLGDRLACVKVRDFAHGQPCALGDGEIDNRGAIESLARAGYAGWVVYEFDRAWAASGKTALPGVDEVMQKSARRLFEWIGAGKSAQGRPDVNRVHV